MNKLLFCIFIKNNVTVNRETAESEYTSPPRTAEPSRATTAVQFVEE